MRLLLSIISLFLITLYAGCSSSSPAPATAEGKWTYTTTDGKIKVNFELVKTASGSMDIKNPATIAVDGISGEAVAQISGVNIPDIASIVISANSIALTYPYTIGFNASKFNSGANRIDVTNGTYTYPYTNGSPTIKSFATISIVRP